MRRVLLAVLMVLVLAASAYASIVEVGDKLTYTGQTAYAQSNGGEFQFTWAKPDTQNAGQWINIDGGLQTFCAQAGEYIYLNTPAYVVNITDNKSSTGQTLSDFGEWLYWAYSTPFEGNTKTSVQIKQNIQGPSLTKAATGGTLQWAFWTDMNYTPTFSLSPAQTAWLALLDAQWDIDKAPGGAWHTFLNSPPMVGKDPTAIAWLSATQGGTGQPGLQDQLVFIPGGLSDVPEPTTILIWSVLGLGAAGVAMKRRKNRLGRWSDENRQEIMSIVER